MQAFSVVALFCTLALTMAGASAGYAYEHETVKPVFQRAIPNIQGKNLVAVVVNYPPGAKSPAHHHAKSAFIYAYVLTGAIRSVVGTEPAKVYQAGESFHEDPGTHHRVSENASETNPASLLAVFIVDADDQPLTVPELEDRHTIAPQSRSRRTRLEPCETVEHRGCTRLNSDE